ALQRQETDLPRRGRDDSSRPTVNSDAVSTAAGLASEEDATIQLFREASPSVVFITTLTVRRDYYSLDLTQIPSGTGSGFVWDRDGNIVTNYHVIQGADRAQITLSDQSSFAARLVGASPERDLAVLRIDAPRDALYPLPIGSSRRLQVGQKAFAIGNPFGLDHTLTTGIVSALGREIESATRVPIRDVIQTDAAINPGNSGGPLLDRNGRLIGVNTSIVSPSGAYAGIGFAIPVDTVAWVVPELIANGRIAQPVLGLRLASSQLNERLGVEGALILAIEPGGPAAQAGLRPAQRDRYGRIHPGDILISLDEKEVRDDYDLYLALERRRPGERLVAVVQRNGATREVLLTLAPSR
ncbi:MAG: trypsin-like peptidase domain-containing protein, partial [Thermoanaerobaculia bacterium]|nr:trypsin-like peptidase domain-containing protein [Thermoanaerobaculia bacterium]